MPGTEADSPIDPGAPAADEATTGLPGLRSWSAVYCTVIAVFALYVVLLTALSRAFR